MREEGITYQENFLPRLRYQYCPMCTTPLTRGVLDDDGIARVHCPACGWVHYPTNITSVVVVIKYEGKIVAILPPGCPPEMPAALPAGHGEYGESPEEAAIREAYEETGLVVEIEQCLGWFFRRDVGYPGPNVAFMFLAKAVGGELRGSEEGRITLFTSGTFPPIAPERKGSYRTMQLYRELIASQKLIE